MMGNQKRMRYKTTGKVLQIPTREIRPNPEQPRRVFDMERLLELAQSIAENGILQPLSITFREGVPVLVAGERRLRAAKIVGLREVPCIEVSAEGERSALLALIENLQREDMNCFEEATGIERLIAVYGFTQEEAANRLGCAQSTVANRLRLLRLSPQERDIILRAKLSERHARALLRLEDPELREVALQRIIRAQMTVAQTERLIEELIQGKAKRRRSTPLVRDVRLFVNTVTHAVDTMRRSGIDVRANKHETEEFIEYVVRIPKSSAMKLPMPAEGTA